MSSLGSRTQIISHWNHKVKFWLFQLQMALAALTPKILHHPISVLTVIQRWLPHRLVFRNNLLPVSSPPGAKGVRPLLRRVKAGVTLILFLALALATVPASTFPFQVSLQSLALTWSWEGDDSLLVSDLLFLAEMQSIFFLLLWNILAILFSFKSWVKGKCIFLVPGHAWSFLSPRPRPSPPEWKKACPCRGGA